MDFNPEIDCDKILNAGFPKDEVKRLVEKLYETEINVREFLESVKNDLGIEDVLGLLIQHHKRRICELSREINDLTRDSLTGLYTRRRLEEEKSGFSAMVERGLPLGFVMLDIDDFKHLNDTHGHQCGDAALRAVGQTIRDSIQRYDQPFRYGGEEFFIVVQHVSQPVVRTVAETLVSKISEVRIPHNGESLTVTASAGYYAHGQGLYSSFDEIVHAVDSALYEAKRSGKNLAIPALHHA